LFRLEGCFTVSFRDAGAGGALVIGMFAPEFSFGATRPSGLTFRGELRTGVLKKKSRVQGGKMKKLVLLLGVIFMATTALAQANLSLPVGTALKARLENTLATFSSKPGDPFTARVTEAVMLDGKTVIPVGATVQGRVTKVSEPRRIAGKPTISIFPETVVLPNGERYMLNATLVDTNLGRGTDVNEEGQFKGSGHDGKNLAEIGAGTGGGMLTGGLIGGPAGMLIGGAVGVTATMAHWLGQHRSAMLPAGTELIMELSRPMQATTASGGQ
jgi:hypothetical protein